MKPKRFVLFSLFLTIIYIGILPENASAATTIYVDKSGGDNYTTIQAAINAANDGDTVYVYSGTYAENVVVNKSINLIGENRDTTVINGSGTEGVVYIDVNWVNMSNFMVTGATGSLKAGIKLNNSANCRIEYNYVYGNMNIGIALAYSNNNSIAHNTCNSNSWRGISLTSSDNNTITNNTCNSNLDYGIYLTSSDNNTITNNTCNSNEDHNIHLYSSDNNTITNNTCSLNAVIGIRLEISSNNDLIRNTCNSNAGGIYVYSSSNNDLIRNTCDSNDNNGIYLSSSSNSTITNNTFDSNNYGIYLSSSSNNCIYHNKFINNTFQAYDGGTNQWDNGYPSGGNYWSDYSGADVMSGPGQNISGSDGIGDTPRNIPGDSNQDRYPLISLWNDTPPGDTTPPSADAGQDQNVTLGTIVTIDGSGSTDNVGIVSYVWMFTYNESIVTLSGVSPNFTFTIVGNYTVTLNVSDAAGNWDTDTITVSVNALPPEEEDEWVPLWLLLLIIGLALALVGITISMKGKAGVDVSAVTTQVPGATSGKVEEPLPTLHDLELPEPPTSPDAIERNLEVLKDWLDQGLINQEQYDIMSNDLLKKLRESSYFRWG